MKIYVHYAYDGFLYAPLFLAKQMGLLPECFVLSFAGSDKQAIAQLFSLSNETDKNWFAICDPLAVALDRRVAQLTGDKPRIVGTLIDKPAFWAYHPAEVVEPVTKEQDLQQYRMQAIQSLICYSRGTTGFVFGTRLSKSVGLAEGNMLPLSFEEEKSQRATLLASGTSLLLTSDALFLAKEALRSNKTDNIVLYYPTLAPQDDVTNDDLSPYMFTAVVTLRQAVIEENLWAVVTLLSALEQAVDILRSGTLPEDIITKLCAQFNTQLDSLAIPNDDRPTLIRAASEFLFQSQRICPADLRPSLIAAEKARAQWAIKGDKRLGSLDRLIDEGPSLLVKRDW